MTGVGPRIVQGLHQFG